jgi:hypothetical protein
LTHNPKPLDYENPVAGLEFGKSMSRVYLSSTFEDLKEYRQAVRDGLLRAGHLVAGMEEAAATSGRPLEVIRLEVFAADIYVGLVAHRYGYIPEDPRNPEQLSITQLEYRAALDKGMPCLVFLVNDRTPWPPDFVDRGPGEAKLAAFKRELTAGRVVDYFSNPDDLAARVLAAVSKIALPTIDVFLSYHSSDRMAVQEIARRLEEQGIRYWMDSTGLSAGDDWRRETESALARIGNMAVFVGQEGIGDLQGQEVQAALRRKFAEAERFRLIPVILPNTSHELIPAELRAYQWVDFGDSLENPEAIEALVRAIRATGTGTATGSSNVAGIGQSVMRGDERMPAERPRQTLGAQDARMVCELLFRLVVRHQRPDILQSLDASAFWAEIRKIRAGASTLEDLRSLHAELSGAPGPGPLWTAWMRNARAAELEALIRHAPSNLESGGLNKRTSLG